MGCGISIFDYRSQRNATEIGFGREKQKLDDYGRAQYNSTTGCTKEREEELNGRVVSRKFSSLSSPPKVFLGIARKFILHGGGGGKKRLVKANEEPSSNSSNTNEYSIPALQHKKEADDADCHDHAATRKLDIVVGEILEIKGVEAAILKEPRSTTKDMIINNAADDDDDQNTNNTPTNDDQEDLARARISDYDGPLWIASPSFRDYCISDSDSDDDIFNGCRNNSRVKIDNNIQLPGDNEEICNARQASMARQVKKGRLTFGMVLAKHRSKLKAKPKPKSVSLQKC